MANNSTQLPFIFTPLLSDSELLFFNIVLPSLSIVGLIVNVIVIIVILSDRLLRRNIENIYIVNLACADILVSVIVVPLWAYQLETQEDNKALCQGTFGVSILGGAISILTLAAISYDRYDSVTRPFLHFQGRKKAHAVVVMIWVIATILSLPFFVGWETTSQPIPLGYAGVCVYTRFFRQEWLLFVYIAGSVIMVVNTVFYVKLLSVAKYHASRIRKDMNSTISFDSRSAHRFKKQKSLKATKTLGLILGVMTLCWVPYLLVAIIDTLRTDFGVSIFTGKLLGTITHFNSVMNPIVYTFMTRSFKNSIIQRIKKKRSISNLCRHTVSTITITTKI